MLLLATVAGIAINCASIDNVVLASKSECEVTFKYNVNPRTYPFSCSDLLVACSNASGVVDYTDEE